MRLRRRGEEMEKRMEMGVRCEAVQIWKSAKFCLERKEVEIRRAVACMQQSMEALNARMYPPSCIAGAQLPQERTNDNDALVLDRQIHHSSKTPNPTAPHIQTPHPPLYPISTPPPLSSIHNPQHRLPNCLPNHLPQFAHPRSKHAGLYATLQRFPVRKSSAPRPGWKVQFLGLRIRVRQALHLGLLRGGRGVREGSMLGLGLWR